MISYKEYLTFVVRLRLAKFSKSMQDNRVEDLINMMGLIDCKEQVSAV